MASAASLHRLFAQRAVQTLRCSRAPAASSLRSAFFGDCLKKEFLSPFSQGPLEKVSGQASCLVATRSAAGGAYYWARDRAVNYEDEAVQEWREKFNNLKPYNDKELRAWRRVFDSMDRDRDGFISRADLQKTPEFTLAKAQKLKYYDADKNNLIDFGEFVEALYNVDKEMFLESFEGFDQVDIQLEFDKYAIDDMSPTKKHIPESRVKEMMLDRKFTCVTSLDAKRLFQEMDVNKDGVVDLADFKECVQRR
ncbi:protein kinase [Toxoplasma gondii TgCatPRC2]|uniref:Protein kinase n=4 Tax=Toxoplasma gondii TaxID=5811 RepID=S7WEG4_TOXGG|nr:protein kinase [Toxoplasma gondii GT1]KFG40205.1 protein kinase [Toxoplasma gondii p89]KFH10843.1 protein kinase [Toxoplasma gondii VAND]KYK70371.1 protein kinase [Toxoplasma gondii TgCatPRC2]